MNTKTDPRQGIDLSSEMAKNCLLQYVERMSDLDVNPEAAFALFCGYVHVMWESALASDDVFECKDKVITTYNLIIGAEYDHTGL